MTTEKTNAPAATGANEEDQLMTGSSDTVPDPVALCRPKRTRTIGGGHVWLLVIRRCPFCRRSHTHGGGSGDEPFYGHRTSHCTTAPGGGYWLKPTEETR
ncbi:hypothetical protein [Streptomyces sp. P9-A2]|uniref:hypothetical protein n=1 Tax=Streptomyces sp. P9-A2 TaxID=3072284 RepID=UPI002FC69D57